MQAEVESSGSVPGGVSAAYLAASMCLAFVTFQRATHRGKMIQGYGDCLGQIGVLVCPGELSGIGSCDLRDTREKVDEDVSEFEEDTREC